MEGRHEIFLVWCCLLLAGGKLEDRRVWRRGFLLEGEWAGRGTETASSAFAAFEI